MDAFFFHDDVTKGDSLSVMPPEGRFITHGEKNIVLIAAGSGITPMISIASEFFVDFP